jgi:hypothetical protein
MPTIIIGVDAGSYIFDASARQITVSGIAGLSLASFKMIQNLTTGKPLYIFNGAPATFAGGVLILNASADLGGAQDTDLLAIYVQSDSAPSLGVDNPTSGCKLLDFPNWIKSAQTTLTDNVGRGPVQTVYSHRLQITASPSNPGLNFGIPVFGRVSGARVTFSCFIRSLTSVYPVNVAMVAFNDSLDYFEQTTPFYPTPQWKRVSVTMDQPLSDCDELSFRLRAGANDIDVEISCPNFFIGEDESGVQEPGSTAFQLTIPDAFGGLSIAAYGDSIIGGSDGGEWLTECARTLGIDYIINAGVGSENSTDCKDRFIAASASGNRSRSVIIICTGRNNYSFPATVLSDIATMVQNMKHGRFLILPVLNSSEAAEASGQAAYVNIKTNINDVLKVRYPGRFLEEVWTERNAGSATDQPRPEYLYDTVHPNRAGLGLIANSVAKAIRANGWA